MLGDSISGEIFGYFFGHFVIVSYSEYLCNPPSPATTTANTSRASAFALSPLKLAHNHRVLQKRASATAKKAQKEGKQHRFRYSYSPYSPSRLKILQQFGNFPALGK
jgi:hypothetical protein